MSVIKRPNFWILRGSIADCQPCDDGDKSRGVNLYIYMPGWVNIWGSWSLFQVMSISLSTLDSISDGNSFLLGGRRER